MGTLTITYVSCGHTSTHALPGQDERSNYYHLCSDCYRAECAQRARETETLQAFVERRTKQERKR